MKRLLSILFTTSALAALSVAQTRTEDPTIPGRAGLRAYKAQKALERLQSGGSETDRQVDEAIRGAGVSIDKNPSGSAASGALASSQSVQPLAEPAKTPPLPLTPLQLAQLKRESKAAAPHPTPERNRIRFKWPTREQAPLKWSYREQEIDGIGEIYNFLETPSYTLSGVALDGYQTVDEADQTRGAGLTLRNTMRPDLQLEFYTFRAGGFLPHLESSAVEAYQTALMTGEVHADHAIELVDALDAQRSFGPGTADLLTRRIHYRILGASSENNAEIEPIEVVDYLIPLRREWLVVRFLAPAELFGPASEEIETFLNRLEQVESELATARR